MESDSLSDYVWSIVNKGGYLDQLKKLWNDLGYSEESVSGRRTAVGSHIQDLFAQMVAEEQESKDQVLHKIENSLKEAAKLNNELNVDIDVTFDESLPLIPLNAELEKRLQKYQVMKAERLKHLSALQQREKELCLALGIQSRSHDTNSVPNEDHLQKYERYLEEKAEERDHLQGIFQETRNAIKAIMDELDIVPELAFEHVVVSGHSFQFSKENMCALKDLHQSLEHQLEDTKASTAQLWEKLLFLWERLHEPHDIRASFSSRYTGYSSATIKALKEEINRCEEKKRINIKKFVEEVRSELRDWWEKCYLSEKEVNTFTHINNTFYTEDLLELHEREVEKLRKFYMDNVDKFTLVKEHQGLWKRRAVLEENAHHPDRLFQNRGGELLREEKERKAINKNLPKIETKLRTLAVAYEQNNGKPFLVFGETVSDYLRHQMEKLERAKEMEKQARKARNQTDATMTSCKSIVSAGKRKVCPSSAGNPQKLQRIAVTSNKPASASKTSEDRVCSKSKERERRSRQKKVAKKMFMEKVKNENHVNTLGATEIPDASTAASNLTYTDFQNHLEQTAACRSSVKPRRCLQELNSAAAHTNTLSATKYGTPGVTPLKRVLTLTTPQRSNHKIQIPRKTPSTITRSTHLTPAIRGKLPFII